MNYDSKPIRQTLSAPEVAEFLGISRSGAYNLLHATDFPSLRVGGRILVTKQAFERWLLAQESKGAGGSQVSTNDERGKGWV